MHGRVSERGAWLALKMVHGVGNAVGLALLRVFGAPAAVFEARRQDLECVGVRHGVAASILSFDQWEEVHDQIERMDRLGGRLVTWNDDDYPKLLRHIHDPPLFLFVLGELTPNDAHSVAVVGSREASGYGLRMTRSICEGLAQYGLTVVSGLARGIDGAAHAGTLAAGGRTIAVLGNGIDVIYPSEHHQLSMRIANNGALVSEFPLGTQPDGENFPSRNRIISGLSLGTVVVEATERSGSLITAECAMEQGREVFAVPGPVGARSRGPHQLIRQGAAMAESADDIVNEIAPSLPAAPPRQQQLPLDRFEDQVLACLEDAPMPIDDVISRTGLSAARVLEILMNLELRGLVHQLQGKRFARNPGTALRGAAER